MGSSTPAREFSAERQLRLRRLGGEDAVTNADLLAAIEALRAEIAELHGTEQATAARDRPAEERESLEARIEIAQMVRAIGKAKLEIAAIKHPRSDDDRMQSAADELDAIVVATETSTEDILGASEAIETVTRRIAAAHPEDEDVLALTEDIAGNIIKIFEACNFQDITGQRITKVVRTLRFIEERILAMINIWGMEAFADLPVPPRENDQNPELLNGPQLPNQGISQDDINALFD